MQPASAIVTRVDDDRIAAAVLAEHLAEYPTEGSAIHSLDVDIADATVAPLLSQGCTAVYPAIVEERRLPTE